MPTTTPTSPPPPGAAARRGALIAVAAAVVVLAVVVGFVVLRGGSSDDDAPAATTAAGPAPSTAVDGAIPVGPTGADAAATGTTTVDLYQDFMCPACGAFERTNAETLNALRAQGVVVRYHLLSFLDRASNGTEYSTRAANAAATVADGAPEHFPAFVSALFAHQPEEGTDGLTDPQIAALATGAGVPDAVAGTFTDGTFRGWVASSTTAAFADGVEHTPTIRIDGKDWDGNWNDPSALADAVTAAG